MLSYSDELPIASLVPVGSIGYYFSSAEASGTAGNRAGMPDTPILHLKTGCETL